MKQEHLLKILVHFNLERLIREPQRVYGGLLHMMWRIDTSKGSYAIKQLSKNINLEDKNIVNNYEISERIAYQFANHGIPAVYAISKNEKCLFIIDDTGYLLYPWVDAKALDKDAISQAHAVEIARLIAQMHILNLALVELKNPEFDIHSNQSLMDLVDASKNHNAVFSDSLQNSLDYLLEANRNYHKAIDILKTHSVISHGDLDQKNVLWTPANKTLLIDWESARKLNPAYEIVNAALDWSGITTEFNKVIFDKMLKAYKDSGGIVEERFIEPALWGVLGNWINWLVYNVKRSIYANNDEEKNLGEDQVIHVIHIIFNIKKLMSELKSQDQAIE